jgi:hypothetical protein
MLDQAFSLKCLKHLLKKEDVKHFRLWNSSDSDDDKDNVILGFSNIINSGAFNFPVFREKITKGKTIYSAPDATTLLLLRKLDRNMRAIYKVKQANRNEIIHQVKSLLKEGCFYSVLRLDISSCYESVDRKAILDKIDQNSILSYTSRNLLNQLFCIPQFKSQTGVPRGLSVSATLNELFLRDLDRKIKNLPHVYYYARYVDDIIIFSYHEAAKVKEDVFNIVTNFGLELNQHKERSIECYNGTIKKNSDLFKGFDFLGYFLQSQLYLKESGNWRKVKIGIAEIKIKKIKSRIVHAFIDFTKNNHLGLLEKRLKFLTGNYLLKKGEESHLLGGVYYNYSHLTDDAGSLQELDLFFQKVLFSRQGSLGKKLNLKLNNSQRKNLVKLSFYNGFKERWSHSIQPSEMRLLHRCWIYEKN